MENYDFSGWATRNDLKCSDGRIIRKDAFKHNDGLEVPLVWNHCHNDPLNVLGHAILENRDEGVYTYGVFNSTEAGQTAKQLVEHGDVSALSIYANQLQQQGQNVIHGSIKEVSLVLAGANPGAYIDSVISHGEESDEEAVIYTGENISIAHASCKKPEEMEKTKVEEKKAEEKKVEEKNTTSEETISDVFETLSEKQKKVVYALIALALEEQNNDDETKEDEPMKHNVFDNETKTNENVISHSDMEAVISDAKRYGSMKDSALAHGIENIDYLFPDAQTVTNVPTFIQRDMGWVKGVMNAVHHTPFSRIKSVFANITEEDARAKGYIKGNLKKDEVFGLLRRTTTPTTVYKKQKLDRDDIVDIIDFDVVAWLKSEMRGMLDEELARAFLIGDGRLSSSEDKINEQNIRPIATDNELYTVRALVDVKTGATDEDKAKAFIKSAIKARKNYKGSGNPTLYTTEDNLTSCLLIEDSMGHLIYDSPAKLANTMRVKEIVTVPVMAGAKGPNSKELMGIIVNLADYYVGADKGGAVNMFDDFDIDYNQQKYLIETRCSGALAVPYSAIALELNETDSV